MVRLTTAFVTTLLAFNHGAQAAPSPSRGRTGYDASLKRPKGPNDIIPEFRVLEPPNSFDGAPRNLNDSVPFAPVGATRQLNERTIIGTDDRVYNSDHNYPFGSIGRIGWSSGVVCSAALVGPRHVLTARHCLPNDPNVWGNFAPGFDNGLTFPESAIVLAVHEADPQGTCGIKSDWAVLILNDRLGEQRGWFGVTLPDRNRFEQPILNHQGYPGDRSGTAQPYLHANARARSENSLDCDETGPVYTNTDTAGGQSGGPLWENRNDGPYIWGDLFGSISWGVNEGFAAFASGSGLLGAVIDLRNEFP